MGEIFAGHASRGVVYVYSPSYAVFRGRTEVREDWLRDKGTSCGMGELLQLTKRMWDRGEEFVVSGLEGGAKGFFASLLRREVSPLLVITPDEDAAEALWKDIIFFTTSQDEGEVLLFPADGPPYEDFLPPWGLYGQKMKHRILLATGRSIKNSNPLFYVLQSHVYLMGCTLQFEYRRFLPL